MDGTVGWVDGTVGIVGWMDGIVGWVDGKLKFATRPACEAYIRCPRPLPLMEKNIED